MNKIVIDFIKKNYFNDLSKDEINTINNYYLIINNYPKHLKGNYERFISNELAKKAAQAVVFISVHRKLLKKIIMNRGMRRKLEDKLFKSTNGFEYIKTKKENAYDMIIASDFFPLDKYECCFVNNYLDMIDKSVNKKKLIQDLITKLYKNRNITYEYVDLQSLYNKLMDNYIQ